MNILQEEEKKRIKENNGSFFGCFCQQNPKAFLSLNRLISYHNFDRFIEIGTHDGGLSCLFALYTLGSLLPGICSNPHEPSLVKNNTMHKSPKEFYTFDNVIRDENMIALLRNMGTIFTQGDTLKDEKIIEYIRNLLQSPGRNLLLCDGGNKKKELELYSPFLKPGDFVMTHDWAYDEKTFEKNKLENIWFSWETRWEDGELLSEKFGIKEICEKNRISQIYSEEFDSCAWFCGFKRRENE